MKCPRCSHNQRSRLGTTCDKCGYQFALDPRDAVLNPLGIADNRMVSILAKTSASGTFYYTDEELFTCAMRILRTSRWWLLFWMSAALLVAYLAGRDAWQVFVGLLALFELIVLGVWFSWDSKYNRKNWDRTWKTWRERIGDPPRYLAQPTMQLPPPMWQETDIYQHGFEKLLIVDRDILVDWLVLNNYHTDHKTVVIARSGYPNYLQPIVKQQLTENPNLRVALLHDTGSAAGEMQKRIEREGIFDLGQREVIDLGLFETDVSGFKCLRRRRAPVPIDAIPYRVLAPGMAVAIDQGLRFSTLLQSAGDTGASCGMYFADDGDNE